MIAGSLVQAAALRTSKPCYVSRTLRSIVCRFSSQSELRRAAAGADHEIPVPEGETLVDGEWLLAIVEVGRNRQATAAAARGVVHGNGTGYLVFEPRDWEQITNLAGTPTQPPATTEESPPTDRSPGSSRRSKAVSSTLRSFATPARVLLVDDDEGIRDVVSAMLEAIGLAVTSVVTGEHALDRLRKADFDMVVLDWTLPGMSGLELCREIRKGPRSAKTPILFLTANASSKDIVLAFGAGADDYVVKPFRAPELGARIFGLLRRARLALETPR